MVKYNLSSETVDPCAVRSVCVLGRGVTGTAVAEFFRGLPSPPTVEVLVDGDVPVGPFDLTITSPGIPPRSELVAAARACSRELIGEPELAYRLSPERWIVVTGTNGKTTTTALTAHVLNVCGMKARVAGNIGATCIDAIQVRQPDEYIIAELSSYQLAYSRIIAPVAAVLLNITPDHLSWHGSFEDYRDAKLALFARMDPTAPAVIDATLAETRAAVRARRAAQKRTIPIGTADGLHGDMTARCGAAESAFVNADNHELTCVIDGRRVAVLDAGELRIKGEHNQENALAAAAVALALGAEPADVAAGLAGFDPLEHRIEPCGSVGGVSFFNDSKATNPEATCKALDAFDGMPLVIMLGGRDKNTPLDELVEAAGAVCKTVVCYGEAGPRIARAFEATSNRTLPDCVLVPDFHTAFDTAVAAATTGDAVLLSPACASFDEFTSYEHRGTAFKALVAALAALRDEHDKHDEREGRDA
jgi:UDP-N-acetylmuramoylalanine--D-glutamate ligase